MSGLEQALTKLDEKVKKLESVLNAKLDSQGKLVHEVALGEQPDMFASVSNQNDPNSPPLTRESVVQQLDMAIAKVEKILAESEAA